MEYLIDSDTCITESSEKEEETGKRSLASLQASFNQFDQTICRQAETSHDAWRCIKELKKFLSEIKNDRNTLQSEVINNELNELDKMDNLILPIVKKNIDITKQTCGDNLCTIILIYLNKIPQTSRMFAILLSKLYIKHYSCSVAFCDDPDLFTEHLKKFEIKFQKDIFCLPDAQSILVFYCRKKNGKHLPIFATVRCNDVRVQILDFYCKDPLFNDVGLKDFMKCIVFLSSMLHIETIIESDKMIIPQYLSEGVPSKYIPVHKQFVYHGYFRIKNEEKTDNEYFFDILSCLHSVKKYEGGNAHDYFISVLEELIREEIDADIKDKEDLINTLRQYLKRTLKIANLRNFISQTKTLHSQIKILYHGKSDEINSKSLRKKQNDILCYKI